MVLGIPSSSLIDIKYSFSRKGKPMAKMESAYFAGGCFWCITPTFKETPGVSAVISGYAGGDLQNPTYKDVKTQKSGHRETIKIDFDSEMVSFDELFSVFLCSHLRNLLLRRCASSRFLIPSLQRWRRPELHIHLQ